MRKTITPEDVFDEDQEYPDDFVEELLEDDELSAAEAAFMHGYEEAR